MRNLKSAFSALVVVGLAAGLLSQSAFAFDGFWNNHARRAEVVGRDQNLEQKIQYDRGHLGGNYGRLMAQDQRILRQEQRDARMNGGHITPQEQQQLNHEENRLNQRIQNDLH